MTQATSLPGLAQAPGSSFRKAQWRMLLAAMFCYLFFYTGRQTFGFAIPGLKEEFGFSSAALGWVSAALLWAYAVGQAINGNLADKYGGRRIMTAGAVLSCGANWIASFATGFFQLVDSLGSQWLFSGSGLGSRQSFDLQLVGRVRTR